MESIRVIQEIIDAHKEQMPTGVVTTVMEEYQKAYVDAQAKLHKLTCTVVDSHAHIESGSSMSRTRRTSCAASFRTRHRHSLLRGLMSCLTIQDLVSRTR